MTPFAGYASSTYASTTGFSAAQIMTWATTTVKLYTGTIFSILYGDIHWIIAAVIIAAIILFAFNAFQFFRY